MTNETEISFPVFTVSEKEGASTVLTHEILTTTCYGLLKSGYFTNLMLVNDEGIARFAKKATRDKTKETSFQKIFAHLGGDIRISLELSDEVRIFSLQEFKDLAIKETRGDVEGCDYVAARERRQAIRKATTFKEIFELFL